MVTRRVLRSAAAALAVFGLTNSQPTRAAAIDLSSLVDQTTPITSLAGSAVTSITSSTPGAFYVQSNTGPSADFITLGAFVLTNSNFDFSTLTINFSMPENFFSANFATADLGTPTAITLTAYSGGAIVGNSTATGRVSLFAPEGSIAFDAAAFDRITLADGQAASFAIGNIQVPEPASVLLLATGLGLLGFGHVRRRARTLWVLGPVALLLAVPPASAQLAVRTYATSTQEMVVTANPLATQAGAAILAQGGNAVDASIAVEAVLGLVEPQATGIGGGGFVLYFNAATKTVTSFDAREAAPSAATGSLFLDTTGAPLAFSTAVFSGKSVGVPTVVKLWDMIARRYGSLPLATLLRPAIDLATNGFAISPRMAASIASYQSILALDPNAARYFLNADGTGKAAGTLLTNPAYANVLYRIAFAGPRAFYSGPIANDIITTIQTDDRPGGPGQLTVADMNNYQVVQRTPICGNYRGYIVCSMGPPSSGGIALQQMLGMLSQYTLTAPNDLSTIHLFLQANRLAFADRNLYVADTDFVPVPVAGLVDPDYLASRAALMTPTGVIDNHPVAAGVPPGANTGQTQDPSPPRFGGTSHVSIIDRFGNVVSQTITVESPFGNNRMVDGFILNNELTDFSFDPGPASAPIANRVQGSKRPRSSMTPTIIFTPIGVPAFVTGSPGGSSIIGTVAQSVVALVDFGLDPQQAANQAHFQNNNTTVTTLESLFSPAIPPGQPGGAPAGTTGLIGPFDVRSLAVPLQTLGWVISKDPTVLTSGLNIIKAFSDGFEGGSDPRREGIALGR